MHVSNCSLIHFKSRIVCVLFTVYTEDSLKAVFTLTGFSLLNKISLIELNSVQQKVAK